MSQGYYRSTTVDLQSYESSTTFSAAAIELEISGIPPNSKNYVLCCWNPWICVVFVWSIATLWMHENARDSLKIYEFLKFEGFLENCGNSVQFKEFLEVLGMHWISRCLSDWLTVRLIAWLIGWLTVWLAGWLTDSLEDYRTPGNSMSS